MNHYEKVRDVVYQAVDEVNTQLLEEQRLEKSLEVVLIGREAKLDSLALINLIIDVEGKISQAFGVNLDFTNEIIQGEIPFKTMGTFIDYLANLLEKAGSYSGGSKFVSGSN